MPATHKHSASFLASQRIKLLRARDDVRRCIESVNEDSTADHTGKDLGDLGLRDTESEFNLTLTEKNHETLRDIEESLIRIEKGTYGICELTSELIPTERLEALPFARCTVKAQRDVELVSHRRRQYGVVFEDTPVPEGEETA